MQAMPVWEITGHEFTKHDVHTADGISIRFPRVVKKRFDKTWETATTLNELKVPYCFFLNIVMRSSAQVW